MPAFSTTRPARRPLLWIGGTLLVLALTACGRGDQARQAPPPAEVTISPVTPADVPLPYEYAGRLAGYRNVEVRARVAGILLERTYVEGATVESGARLFRIDPEPFQAALAKAEADLQSARARLAQAERDHGRVKALFERGNASQRARDDAQAALDQARAAVAAAAAVDKKARIDLDYTTVEAPVTGITSLEVRSEGSLVGSDPSNSLLTRITQIDPLYVDFAVADSERTTLRDQIARGEVTMPEDGKLALEVRGPEGKPLAGKGEVRFTDTVIDEHTGTVRVRGILPNPDHRLLPGQFVRVVVEGLTLRGALTIPEAALMQGPRGAFVYTVAGDGTAEMRPVEVAGLVGGSWIVRSGLKAGDRVISEGILKVRPGAPVSGTAPTETAARP
jgi:membrane fusion protein (multidrug efflux system)